MGAPLAQITDTAETLLDLNLQGHVLRFTTGPQNVTVFDADGNPFLYTAGMQTGDATVEMGTPFTSLGVDISPGVVDWSLLRKRGHRLDLGGVVIRRWYDGQLLEQAQIVIRGKVTTPRWGDSFQAMSFGVERQLRQQGFIPKPSHRISSDTWPVEVDTMVDPGVVGKDYQIIIGFPGRVDGVFAGPVSTAYMVEWQIGAALGRQSRAQISLGEVHASHVTLYDASAQEPVQGTTLMTRPTAGGITDLSQEGPWRVAVIDGVDKRGQPVSMIGWTEPTIPGPALETNYRIAWDRIEGGEPQGGILNRERTAPLRGAGEIIRYLLEEWTDIELDVGAMEAQRSILDAYKLDFVIGRRTRVWDFIRSSIAPLLPIEWRETSSGGYFQAWKLDATLVDVVDHLVATPNASNQNVVRTSRFQSTAKRIYNRVVLNYAPGGQQQKLLRTVIADANPDASDDRVVAEYLAHWSQTLYGIQDLDMSASVVSDEATARLIAQDKLLQHAVPRNAFTVESGTWLDKLDLNSVLLFTDEQANIFEELAIVRAKTPMDQRVSLDLLLLEDPTKTIKGTS